MTCIDKKDQNKDHDMRKSENLFLKVPKDKNED